MPENNEERKFIGSGVIGGILGAGTASTLVSAQEAKRRARLIAAGKTPTTKRALLWNILELGAAAAGAAGGGLAERRLVKGPAANTQGDTTMLPPRLRYHLSELASAREANEQQKTASLPAKKLLGSEFLGLLAGGNTKRLASNVDAAAARLEELKSVTPTRADFRQLISKKKLEAAAAKNRVSADDVRIATTPVDELTDAEKLRKQALVKKYRTGFFEAGARVKAYKGKVSEAEKAFQDATNLSDEELARVSSARTRAAVGVGATGAAGAGGYMYLKKRKRDAEAARYNNY